MRAHLIIPVLLVIRPRRGRQRRDYLQRADRAPGLPELLILPSPGGVPASGVLRSLDINKDGAIQESEPTERLKAVFPKIDRNSNGTLEENELGPVVDFLNAERTP